MQHAYVNVSALQHIKICCTGQVLSDLAGIYLLGRSPGTHAHRNLVHDIYPYYRFGHGIYLDQACSDVLVEDNLAYYTEGGVFYQHYGLNNTVRSNIFALPTGGVGAVWSHADSTCECDIPSECADMVACGIGRTQGCCSDLAFEHNIVYVDARVGPRIFGMQWKGNSSFDANVYFNASADSGDMTPSWPTWNRTTAHCANATRGESECSVCNVSWAARTSAGQDADSVQSDPQFVDVARHNFTLRPTSPALALQFDRQSSAALGNTGPRSSQHDSWRSNCSRPCAALQAPANGSLSGAGHGCGDVVVAHCDAGFKLIGSVARTCGSGGWSPAKAASCVATPRSVALLQSAAGTYYSALPTGGYLLSDDHKAYASQRSDGRLCVYHGQPPSSPLGTPADSPIWCSSPRSSGGDAGQEYHTTMQSDGNLCTNTGAAPASNDPENFRVPSIQVWCANSNPRHPPPSSAGRPQYYAAIRAATPVRRAELCVFRGTMPPAQAAPLWCSGNHS